METFKVKNKKTGEILTIRKKSNNSIQEESQNKFQPIQENNVEQNQPQKKSNFLTAPLKERIISGVTGGVVPAVGGATNAEKIAPAMGGILGGLAGARVGKPNLGAGVGAGIGKLYEDSIKKIFRGGDDIDVKDAVVVGGLYGLGGKAFETALKSIGVAGKIIPEAGREKFFKKALQAVNIGKKAMSRNFGRAINKMASENPNVKVDMSGVMSKLSNQINGLDDSIIPQFKTASRNNPKLAGVLENPALAKDLTIKEAIELKNMITSSTNSITNKAMKGKTTPNERIVFDMLDDIDDAISSKFPQMREIRKIYSEAKKDFDLTRPLVEGGKAVEANIFNKPVNAFGIGGTPFMGSTMGKLATKRTMSLTPAGAKMYKAAELAHKLNRAADIISRMGLYVAGASGASALLGGGAKKGD